LQWAQVVREGVDILICREEYVGIGQPSSGAREGPVAVTGTQLADRSSWTTRRRDGETLIAGSDQLAGPSRTRNRRSAWPLALSPLAV